MTLFLDSESALVYNTHCVCPAGYVAGEKGCEAVQTCPLTCPRSHNLQPASSTPSEACPTQCECLPGFVMTRPAIGNQPPMCECAKQLSAENLFATSAATPLSPALLQQERQCHFANTHVVSYTTERCAHIDPIEIGEVDFQARALATLSPTRMTKQCICRLGYSGQFCEYSSALAVYELNTTAAFMTSRELLQEVLTSWNQSASANLYHWNDTTSTAVVELWNPAPQVVVTTTNAAPLAPSLFATRRHNITIQQNASTGGSDDLARLFELWEQMQGAQPPQTPTTPTTLTDPTCPTPLTTTSPPHCQKSAPVDVNNDKVYDQEVKEDDQRKGLFDSTFDNTADTKKKISTALIIIIPAVVGSLVFFAAVIIAVMCCKKHEKACFAKKKSKTTKTSKSATTLTPASSTSSTPRNSGSLDDVEMGSTCNTSLSPTIMPTPISTTEQGGAALPEGWQMQVDPSTGKQYYMNLHTLESSWRSPLEAQDSNHNGW